MKINMKLYRTNIPNKLKSIGLKNIPLTAKRTKALVVNNIFDVILQPSFRKEKWQMFRLVSEVRKITKEKIYSIFEKRLELLKKRFYRKPKKEQTKTYRDFANKKDALVNFKLDALDDLSPNSKIISKYLTYYFSMKKKSSKTINVRLNRLYNKLYQRKTNLKVGLFNFNTATSSYITAVYAKKRFEFKFSRNETAKMLMRTLKRHTSGLYIVLAGRFTKNIRATKEEYLYGKVSSNSVMAPIDYHQSTAIIRYGASSTKMQVSYNIFSILGGASFSHRSLFKVSRRKMLYRMRREKKIILKLIYKLRLLI